MTVYCAIVRDALGTCEGRRIWGPSEDVARTLAEAYVRDDPEGGRHLTVIQEHRFPQDRGALVRWLNIHFGEI